MAERQHDDRCPQGDLRGLCRNICEGAQAVIIGAITYPLAYIAAVQQMFGCPDRIEAEFFRKHSNADDIVRILYAPIIRYRNANPDMDHNSFSIISSLFKARTMTLWAQYYLRSIATQSMEYIRGVVEVCCPIIRFPPVKS